MNQRKILMMSLSIILKRTQLFSLAFLLTFVCTAQQYAVSNIPKELLEKTNTVVRYDFTDFKVFSPKRTVEKVKYVVTLLNEKSHAKQHVVHYDKYTTIAKYHAKVYDAKGELVKTYGKKEMIDVSNVSAGSIYDDDRIKAFSIEYDEYPYTIVYEYEKRNLGTLFYPSKLFGNFSTSFESIVYTISMPDDMDFRYQHKNIDIEPQITTAKGRKKHTWSVKNVAAKVHEKYIPSPIEVLPMVLIVPNEIHVEKYKGEISTWKSFGNFFYELNKNRDKISSKLESTVKALTASAKSDREKIDILYKFLQEKNRYISVQLGIGGWQTYDAKYVEKNKYGDCKALSNFMMSMLKSIGIESHTVLVDRKKTPRVMQEDFAVDIFNHVILYVPKEDVWLECTNKNNPINYLDSSTEGRKVLLVTEEGGVISKTPSIPVEENSMTNQVEIVLMPSGEAKLKNVETTRGIRQDDYRYFISKYSGEKLKEWFYEKQKLPSFTINELELKVEEDKPEAQLIYSLDIKRYASKAGKRLFVPLNSLNTLAWNLPEDKNRQYPIKVGYGSGIYDSDKYSIEIPEGYEIESIPKEDIQIDSDYGNYIVKITQAGNKINYERKLKVKSGELPPEEYNKLREFYTAIAKADKMKLVLVKKKT